LAGGGPARVEFLGKLDHRELPRLYRENHVFVFPSEWAEPFGLTYLEAMASSLPVVSTAEGGQGEFLVHEENCLVFRPGQVGGLTASLARLADDPGLARRLARAGREVASGSFSQTRYLEELEEFLHWTREATP